MKKQGGGGILVEGSDKYQLEKLLYKVRLKCFSWVISCSNNNNNPKICKNYFFFPIFQIQSDFTGFEKNNIKSLRTRIFYKHH